MDTITKLQRQLVEAIEAEKQKLEDERKEFETEKEEWSAVENKLKSSQTSSRVKLDVGGKVFSTSLSTVTNGKSGYFSAMFSGRWQVAYQEGEIFIDRDPLGFPHILNLLRGEDINITVLSPQEKLRFEKDIEFYQVSCPSLTQTLSTLSHTPWTWSHLFMSENGYTLTGNVAQKDKNSGSMYIIRAVPAIQRNEAKTWKISIDCERPITEDLDIGVVSYECIGKDCWLRSDPLAKYIQNPIQGNAVFFVHILATDEQAYRQLGN